MEKTDRLPFWKDRLLINFIGIGLALNIVLWIMMSVQIPAGSGEIPLHYLANFGIDIWGEPSQLYALAGIGLVVLATNVVLGILIYRAERLAARILAAGAAMVQLILLVAAIFILNIQ